jgi:hypothetical protein
MANTRARNVIRVDTTATFSAQTFIHSIKYIGASSGTAIITSADSTNKLWEESGTSNVYNPNVDISGTDGIVVTVTNSAVVYLYLKP